MTHAIAEPTDSRRFRMAVGHNPAAGGGWMPVAKAYLPLSMAGAGAVLSMTAADLLRYAQAHMKGSKRTTSGQPILSRHGLRAMQTPQLALPPYSQHRYRHMGLGWFLDVDSRHPKMNHDGATMQQFASARESVVYGKSVSERVDLGCGRNIKKKTATKYIAQEHRRQLMLETD